MKILNSRGFILEARKAVEELVQQSKIPSPTKIIESKKASGITFGWKDIIIFFISDDASNFTKLADLKGTNINEFLFARCMDSQMMGATAFIPKKSIRKSFKNFVKNWFP